MISNEKNKNGFTLIELMIVMVIMGVLATIGVGSFISSQKKSRDVKRKSELRQVAQALEAYYNDNGVYPAADSSNKIKTCSNGTLGCDWGSDAFKSNSGNTTYMIKLPKDPKSDWRYYYVGGSTYKLYSGLENDQDAGEGVKQSGYTGTNCHDATSTELCKYGISSPSITP